MEATWVRHLRFPAPLIGVQTALPAGPTGPQTPSRSDSPRSNRPSESPTQTETDIVGLLEEISRSLVELDQRRRQNLHELQQVAIELSLVVVSHILQEQLDTDAFPIERLVGQAIERLAPHQPIEVHLHPQDLRMMERQLANRSPEWKWEHVCFLPDVSLSRGSCRAEVAEFGLLSSLEQRLGDVRQRLLEGLEDAEIERRQPKAGADSLRRFPDRRETA